MDPKSKKVLICAVVIIFVILVVFLVSDAFMMKRIVATSETSSNGETQSTSSSNIYPGAVNVPAASDSMEWTLPGETITLQIASTSAKEELGLGGRTSLSSTSGMFFVFDTPNTYGFWMKDMEFPLDIIWLDQDFNIVHIEHDLSPSTYPQIFYPGSPAKYVIEVNAGTADEFSLKVGQIMNIH